MQSPGTKPIEEDMQRIEQFADQVVTDLAAAMAGVMINLGHKLGLYRAMAESGPINSDSDELAHRTATNERSVREWLNGQVAGGYVVFDANTNHYLLPPEHAFVLALFTGSAGRRHPIALNPQRGGVPGREVAMETPFNLILEARP